MTYTKAKSKKRKSRTVTGNCLLKSNDPFWNERAKHVLPDYQHSALTLTISASFGMFTDISTQPTSPVSYPAPTFGALRNILRHLAPHLKSEFIPIGVEILNPVEHISYGFNLTGPGRKPVHHTKECGAMFSHMILRNPKFRVFFAITNKSPELAAATLQKMQSKIQSCNHRDIFMGARNFPAHVQYSNPEEKPLKDVNFLLPSMLKQICYNETDTIEVYHDVPCLNGRLIYPTLCKKISTSHA